MVDIQNTLTDVARFPAFMAYMTVSKFVDGTDHWFAVPDGLADTFKNIERASR